MNDRNNNHEENTNNSMDTLVPTRKKNRSTAAPNNIRDALMKDQNKLIHLDPVPLFETRLDIKPWLQKIFFPQGIDIVTERSDKTKAIFKCKSHPQKLQKNNEDEEQSQGIETKRKNTCPFRIRATFSLKLQKWNIVVVNNVHSHPCEFNPESDEYKKFKKYLTDRNDVQTIKSFEELEYKTKYKLPIMPEIISCDCGMTDEVNWFNVILPTPRISGIKKICKKKRSTALSKVTALQNNKDAIKVEADNNRAFMDITLKDTVVKNESINLDEIDFTDMFKYEKLESEAEHSCQAVDFTETFKIGKSPKNDIDTIGLDFHQMLGTDINPLDGSNLVERLNATHPEEMDFTNVLNDVPSCSTVTPKEEICEENYENKFEINNILEMGDTESTSMTVVPMKEEQSINYVSLDCSANYNNTIEDTGLMIQIDDVNDDQYSYLDFLNTDIVEV